MIRCTRILVHCGILLRRKSSQFAPWPKTICSTDPRQSSSRNSERYTCRHTRGSYPRRPPICPYGTLAVSSLSVTVCLITLRFSLGNLRHVHYPKSRTRGRGRFLSGRAIRSSRFSRFVRVNVGNNLNLIPSPLVDPSLRDLVDRVLPLATYYTGISTFVESRSHTDYGLVNHALCASIRDMLKVNT